MTIGLAKHVRQISLFSLILIGTPCIADVIEPPPVTVSGRFLQYQGAVGNGSAPVFGSLQYQSIMNGANIAPSAPLPGLEELYVAPEEGVPDSVGQGIGLGTVDFEETSSFSFYSSYFNPETGTTTVGLENVITFTPGPEAHVIRGDEFLLGTFAFQNGEWWAADAIHRFTLELETHSPDPTLNGHLFSDTLVLHITPNGGPPENRADFFYFEGHPELGSIRVYESFDGNNYGTVDLYGKIGSLIPTELTNPTGGVFLSESTEPFPLPPVSVPEPGTWWLLGTGAATLLAVRRRRKAS